MHVNQVSLPGQGHPAMFIDTSSFLVHKESFVSLHQLWLLVVVIKVSHQIVWVEIMFLDAEDAWQFSLLIQILVLEHSLPIKVLDNIVGVWIKEVALLIGESTALILVFSIIILLWGNNISLFVVINVSKNIVNVESS